MKNLSKVICILGSMLIFLAASTFAQVRPFTKGERLIFSVEYGPVKAGTATFEISEVVMIDSVPAFHIVSTEETNAFFFENIQDRGQVRFIH